MVFKCLKNYFTLVYIECFGTLQTIPKGRISTFHFFFWFCLTLKNRKEKNNCLSVIINPLMICQTQADLYCCRRKTEILYSAHTELSLIINTWGMFSLLSNKHSVSTSLGIHWFTGKWSKPTKKEEGGEINISLSQ